ncbi:hypothetical protein FGF1_07000 [Flavobacteriaceae bacterium GF1]
MKNTVFGMFLFLGITMVAQSVDYNTKKGYVANGYDVVAYFDGAALKGNKTFVTEYTGAKFTFASDENLKKFIANPEMYLPKYGGYCAYAVAVAGKKVSINPETYEIRDGELYLFYNSGKNNTLESWLAESPEKLKVKADKNWETIKKK